MSKQKEAHSNLMDPNRLKIAKNMALMPGGPDNNQPMNVTSINTPPITGMSIYGDYEQTYPQMGAQAVNPNGVRNTGRSPYGDVFTPFDLGGTSPVPDGMEAGRQAQEAQMRGLMGGAMGLMGQPVMPAGLPPNMPGTSGPDLMTGVESATLAGGGLRPQNSMNAMTPGASKTTIRKPEKKRA